MYRAIRQATTPTMFPRKLGNGSKGRITTAIHDQLSAARLRVNQDSTAPRHRQFVSPLVQYRNSRACCCKSRSSRRPLPAQHWPRGPWHSTTSQRHSRCRGFFSHLLGDLLKSRRMMLRNTFDRFVSLFYFEIYFRKVEFLINYLCSDGDIYLRFFLNIASRISKLL